MAITKADQIAIIQPVRGQFETIPSRVEGANTITAVHEFTERHGFPLPNGIGMRILRIPPNGTIPDHKHERGDETAIICLEGSGTHIIRRDGKIVEEYPVRPTGISMHQQCATPDTHRDAFSHSYVAGPNGLTLISIYNADRIDAQRLRDIHVGESTSDASHPGA